MTIFTEEKSSTSPPERTPLRRARVRSTVGAIMLFAVMSAGYGMGFWIAPGAEKFGVPITQFLLWYSIWTISTAVAFVPMGKLITVFGVKKVALITSAVAVILLVGMAVAPSIGLFYVLAAGLGVAWSGFTTLAANTLITGWHENRRGTLLGVAAASTGLVGILYGFVYPPIVATWGFTGAVLALAVHVAVLGLIPSAFLISNPPRATGIADDKMTQRGNRKRFDRFALAATALAALAAFCFTVEATFSQVLPAVFSSAGFDAAQVGTFVSYYALCSMLATPIIGYMTDRIGLKAAYAVMTMLFIAGTPAIALFHNSGAWAFWLFLPIAAMSVSVSAILLPIVTTKAVGVERFPVAYGAVAAGLWIGLAVAAPTWGAVYDATGSFDMAMYFAGIAGLLGLGLAASVPLVGSRIRNRASREAVTSDPA